MIDNKKAKQLISWLNQGAQPHRDGRNIVDTLCGRLVDAGVKIDRFALFIFTIHPTIRGRRIGWNLGEGTKMFSAGHEVFDTKVYHNNPIPSVIKERITIRRRLMDDDCPNDYIIVEELRSEGFTDYFITPLEFVSGEVHCASWSSRDENGFSDDAISLIREVCHPLARLTEIYMLRLNSATLLSTYIGRNAGTLVLNGQIKIGDGEDIQAIILFADLKDFTMRSNSQESQETLDMLNIFFGALEEPIRQHGGEILKFMGDGLLAIFPFDDTSASRIKAVNSACECLYQARESMQTDDSHTCDFRAALHLGNIHYGNIGAEQRLDFTAIGPAVNLTARLLASAQLIGHDFVCSPQVAKDLNIDKSKAQLIEAKGFAEPQQIFPVS